MLYGITDIGSNTIRFKVYSVKGKKIKNVISKKRTAGLVSYVNEGVLTQEGIDILISTLNTFQKNMRHLNVQDIHTYYFATASLRNISNTNSVVTKVKNMLNIDIHVLTGEQEATYTFDILKTKYLSHNDGILIDVGGGSTEITEFKNKTMLEKVSLPIASLNAYYEYVSLIIPNEKETEKIRKRTLKEIKESNISKRNCSFMYAVGGTIRAISKIMDSLGIKEHNSKIITKNQLKFLKKELTGNNKEVYKKILQIKAERIHTIVPGLIIIQTIVDFFQTEEIYICQITIRDGIIRKVVSDNDE